MVEKASALPWTRVDSICCVSRTSSILGRKEAHSTYSYIDPGNYSTDLVAGATYGYKLLFIVLLSGLIGIMMQILSARLGIVTGKGAERARTQSAKLTCLNADIAALCRQSLHSRERHRMFWRWGVLYPLYFIAEGGLHET